MEEEESQEGSPYFTDENAQESEKSAGAKLGLTVGNAASDEGLFPSCQALRQGYDISIISGGSELEFPCSGDHYT